MKINPPVTVQNFGGKGYQLKQLSEICNVPSLFVLSFEDDREIGDKNNQAKILEAFTQHGFDLVSVRSSATVEDSVKASFAGIFETKLNVKKENLISSISYVLNSVNDSRVAKYCELNNIDTKTIKMRIVIQKMVDSAISGVCVTRESKTGKEMLIEACYGLGESLVGGSITPDTFKVDRDTFAVISKTINYQSKMLTLSGEKPVQFFLRNCQKITDEELNELSKTCLMIEQKLGYVSADIEWAFENEKLFILQSRPFVAIAQY